MLKIKFRRLLQVFQFGWKDACDIAQTESQHGSKIAIFCDILHCFRKYYLSGYQYKKNRLWDLSGEEKKKKAILLGNDNKTKDEWLDKYYKNWLFINKYSGVKWETSQRKRAKRNDAYTKFYGFGNNCWTQRDVSFLYEHFCIGNLKVGDNCFFARGCDLDYTSDLEIGNNVKISEGVKILTHNHDLDYTQRELGHGLIKTPLVIMDNVGIGARAVIMPGVSEIGRRAMITTCAVVKKQVPPYAIVMGNPARVVGFRYTPDQILEFEEDAYPIEERLSEEVLITNYKKYYLDKLQEIKQFLG